MYREVCKISIDKSLGESRRTKVAAPYMFELGNAWDGCCGVAMMMCLSIFRIQCKISNLGTETPCSTKPISKLIRVLLEVASRLPPLRKMYLHESGTRQVIKLNYLEGWRGPGDCSN